MYRVQTFCFCLSLRIGAIVAALITVVGVVLTTTTGVYFILLWHHIWEQHGRPSDYDLPPRTRITQRALQGSAAICFSLAIPNFMAFVIMIVGIIKNKSSGLFIPWLVCGVIDIVLHLLTTITLLALGHWLVLISVPVHAFTVYLWMVVHSYYSELKASDTCKRKLSYYPCRSNSTSSNLGLQYHVISLKG